MISPPTEAEMVELCRFALDTFDRPLCYEELRPEGQEDVRAHVRAKLFGDDPTIRAALRLMRRVAPPTSSPNRDPAPCVDCGEDPGTLPDGRCRDCDLEYVASWSTCRSCRRFMIRVDVAGPLSDQHAPDCPLRFDPDCLPRTCEEAAALRSAHRLPQS